MEHFTDHVIHFDAGAAAGASHFEAAEALQNHGTQVDVLPINHTAVNQRIDDLQPPWAAHAPSDAQKTWTRAIQKQTELVRQDPGYQFIMKVAGFTNRNLKSLINIPGASTARGIPEPVSNAYVGPVPPQNDDERTNWHRSHEQYKWMSVPEISGVVHLSASLYGHIQEAQDILERVVGQRFRLESLVERRLSTLFARLVGLRIHMSQFLSGVNYQLDRTYNRLHREQHLVLRSFRCELSPVHRTVSRPQNFSRLLQFGSNLFSRQVNGQGLRNGRGVPYSQHCVNYR